MTFQNSSSRLLLVLLWSAVIFIWWCKSDNLPDIWPNNQDIMLDDNVSEITTAVSTGYEIEIVWWSLEVPWSIAFVDVDTFYVTERWWVVYRFDKWEQLQHYFTIPDAVEREEAGLMGIAIDPDYNSNHYVYLSYATDKHIKVVRYTDDTEGVWLVETVGDDGRLMKVMDKGAGFVDPYMIIDMLPLAQYHAWWWVWFGPDGKLYISVGDAIERNKAQDLDTYHGKILRLNPDWSIPDDNPFSWSAIWSYGHRNVQWFDRDSDGMMYASEHGPSGFDGPGGGDEINKIVAWSNYGRPVISHDKSGEWLISPLIAYTPAVAPASLMIYNWSMFPEWVGKIFVWALRGESIIIFDPINNQEITKLFVWEYGRIRAVTQSPDGSIFFTTSNRDGRWDIQQNDDKIYRIYR